MRPEYVEELGRLGAREGSMWSYHRFHLPHIDAWGILSYLPTDPIEIFSVPPREYMAEYLALQLHCQTVTEAQRWIRGRKAVWVPAGWRIEKSLIWRPDSS